MHGRRWLRWMGLDRAPGYLGTKSLASGGCWGLRAMLTLAERDCSDGGFGVGAEVVPWVVGAVGASGTSRGGGWCGGPPRSVYRSWNPGARSAQQSSKRSVSIQG